MASPLMPTLYITHGAGPAFLMEGRDALPGLADWSGPDSPLAHFLRGPCLDGLPSTPTALLVVSAHWEEPTVAVQSQEAPGMLYDYGGFPESSYQLQYPARGSPQLASRVVELLKSAGVGAKGSSDRGFDHGVFVPLLLAAPSAQIPVFQVSLHASLDPATHLTIGKALAPLRKEGVLIIGSGSSSHGGRVAPEKQGAWEDWLAETCTSMAGGEREDRLLNWSRAPSARQTHRREEHLLPLHVAVGAAMEEKGECTFRNPQPPVLSCFRFG